MGLRRSVVLVAAIAGTTTLVLGLAACRKTGSGNVADGGKDADASDADADAATAFVEEDASPVAPAPTSKTFELASTPAAALPFTGTYHCFNGLKLEQAGRIVTATMHKGTTDTVLACTASADTCTGTVREIVMVRGKAPKVNHVKPVTLTRTKSGDVVYVVGSPDKKPGRGDQTLCPRR